MLKLFQSWLDAREAHGGIIVRWLLAGMALAAGLHALQESSFGKLLDQKLIQVIEFRLRSAMGRAPTLDPRLKIYFMDDRSIRSLGRDDLDLREWATFFSGVAAADPSLIMVDKFFGSPRGAYDPAEIRQTLQNLGAPVASIVFLTPDALKNAAPMPQTQSAWQRDRYVPAGIDPLWLPVKAAAVYGPHPDIQQSFSLFGHAHYQNGGIIELFHRPAPDVFIPHWSLLAAKSVELKPDGAYVNAERITARSNELMVNFLDREAIYKHSFSIDGAVRRAERQLSFRKLIEPGQIILILPTMYTGSPDLVESPFGPIPGGYMMIAMVNSVVSGQWIRMIASGWWELLLAVTAGVLVGLLLEPLAAVALFLLGSFGMMALGLGLFTYGGTKIFWLWPDLGFSLMVTGSFAWKMIRRDSKNRTLREALADVIATDQLQKILKNPQVLVAAPSSQNVSILFIDLVGFSLSSQRLTPAETFAQLKDLLSEATHIIHQHEGVIDKTLGDGLLCFFGYNLLGETQKDHADRAVLCALEIQQRLYERCFIAFDKGQALYPARIGINTAQVYVGNIGNETRFDFTLIGDGVNLASRLESACEPFRIMIGADTRELLSPRVDPSLMIPRYVRIKHSQQLLKAWQVDPFHHMPHAIERAEKLYWAYARIERLEERVELPALRILLRSEHGVFELTDCSRTGLAFVGDIFLAKDVTLDVSIDAEDEDLMQALRNWGLNTFTLEIRWGKVAQHRFKHGARILGLNSLQKTRIFEELQRQGRPAA